MRYNNHYNVILYIVFFGKDVYAMSNKITKDMIIGEILDLDPDTAPYFLDMGMHCLGCPSARGESLEDACAVHGVNADEMVEKLNKFLAEK